MENEDGQFVYTIHGVKVSFPCKAYPTQLSMMNMVRFESTGHMGPTERFPYNSIPIKNIAVIPEIIKGIERHQNSLLESPTGSGKSLALLCSCLAWQSAEYEKKAKIEEQMKAEIGNDEGSIKTCSDERKPLPTDPALLIKSEYFHQNNSNLHEKLSSETPLKTETSATPIKMPEQSESLPGKDIESRSPTDDDFQPAKKRFRTPGNNQTVSSSKKRRVQPNAGPSGEDEADYEPPEWTMELTIDRERQNISPNSAANVPDKKDKLSPDDSGKSDTKSERLKIPKIFFGTRTHKQIAQISRELKKTVYKHVKMTILSSREHSCVHPVVSKGKSKNEECKKLRDGSEGMACRYYQKVHTIRNQTSLRYHGLSIAWDIEDLVTLGSQIKACPYYAARELMKEADIIFCPYNYLIDPKIRMQMDINLKDQIVVLDEAHNVEDSAREAGSLTLTTVELQNTLDELDKLVQMRVLTEHHQPLHLMIGSFLRWIHESSAELKERGFEQSSKVWSGMEIVAAMEKQAITPGTFYLYFEHYMYIMETIKDPTRSNDMPTLSTHSQSLLEGIFLIGKYMMANDMQYISDYRCAVLKTSVMVKDVVLPGGWRRSHGGARKEWTQSLNFWCLNPAVVFSELGSQARCIVLTSGTLSPMASFSSELGIKFPIQLEANHVIANSQVWVGTLSSGPSGSAINASYRSAETFTFQDEVGKVLLHVCETVPHGVLCFFPSYNMLDKLSKRWQSTGLWSKLVDRKVLVSEPRSGDKSDFDDIMHQFYHAVRASEGEESNTQQDSDDESCVDGGLFLAVCRGKVSEGLDFADNNARAVITIGIPFPNVKDIQVELKRKYNTQYSASRGLLTGSEWYEIQAYRALNQALGRCIRHKQDWGAILLIDERFNKSPKYTNGISKWVRKRISKFNNFNEAMSSLKEFATARKLDPCPSSSSPSSLSQLSRNTVETPAKEQGICSRTKPLEDHRLSPLLDPIRTPIQRTGTKPYVEQTSPVNNQGNQLFGFMPASNLTPSVFPEATSHGVTLSVERAASKLAQFKRETVGQGESKRHVFKGMTSVSDFKPINGVNISSSKHYKINEQKKVDNQASGGEVRVNHANGNSTNEQLSYSPVLFATPQSSPSPSPVKQEFDAFKPFKGEKRTSVNSLNMNSSCHVLNNVKPVGNGPTNISKTSIGMSNETNDFGELVSQGFVEEKKPCQAKEESKPRDFLDEVETNFPQHKSELANGGVNSNEGEGKSANRKECKFEIPSNVRRGRRKSSRLTRSSNGTGNTGKEQKEACEEKPEVKGGSLILCCARCGSSLVSGCVVVRPFPQNIPELLRSFFKTLQTIDDKSVNVIDKGASEIFNLGYRIDARKGNFSGVNSIFVPESEICYIPQVCKVCQSTWGDSHIVGLQVVSFRTSYEELFQPFPKDDQQLISLLTATGESNIKARRKEEMITN